MGQIKTYFANAGKALPLKARRSIFLMSAGFLPLCQHQARTLDIFLPNLFSETVVKINHFQLSLSLSLEILAQINVLEAMVGSAKKLINSMMYFASSTSGH